MGEYLVAIRKATVQDLAAITEIYNDAIINTVATFDTQSKTTEEQETWFKNHDKKHPILVAEINGKVVGWISLTEWADRCAYADTSELSVYIREENQGKGIGKSLVEAIIEEGKNVGLHVIVARSESSNKIIVHMLEKFGFEHIGVMKEVGKKFGRLLDVIIMQKIL